MKANINYLQKGGWLNKRLYKTVNSADPYPENFSEIINHVKNFVSGKEIEESDKEPVADAAWRKRLDLPYNKKLLLENKDGSYRLPNSHSNQFLTDTTKVKERINKNLNIYPEVDENKLYFVDNERYNVVQKDRDYLNKLRRMYNNKDTINVNEYQAYKNRDLFSSDAKKHTPFNVMQNFKMYLNKDGKIMYEDIYDFNNYEWGIPGKPFKIKGYAK